MITFACFSPHPPILLPSIGSDEDRQKVKKTIENLKYLGKVLERKNPDNIIISSPHQDWGFNVPLYFLADKFRGELNKILTGIESPQFHFEKGKEVYKNIEKSNKRYALIASGDLSHRLSDNSPYGFNPQGPKFDESLIKFLKRKDVKNFLELDNYFPEAGECGLRSFSFLLGILGESKIEWQPEILSYEKPFGIGYLVVNFKLI